MEKKDIKNCAIIYNPVSTGFKKEKLYKIKEVLENNNIESIILPSEKKGHVIDLIKQANENSDLIMTLGGDGTVSEAYKAFNEINQRAYYSHVPTGTTNDMAKNFNVRFKDADLITKDILNGEIVEMDSFKINDEVVAYTSVFGYLAHVPYVTSSKLKQKLSHGGYVLSAFPYIIKKPVKYNITYETDNIKGNCNCILGSISNSKGFAGIELFPKADLSDGKLELLLITKSNKELIASIVKDYLKKDVNLDKYKNYIIKDTSKNIKLTFNDIFPTYPFDNDGEKSLILPDKNNPTVNFSVAKPIKVLKRKLI